GLPGVGEEDLFFTDADLEALEHVVRLLREGAFDEATALSMTRALARSADRLASWQSSLVIEAVLGEQDPVEMPVVTDVAATLESDREADEEL
ncbi:hypothetical protein ACP3V9_24130, partial [Salmonella enterica]|uniref:hypothetical protein n=1 Tax=Salmonella enterica TaxID=28901 RepID=UPI003CF0E41E